MSPKIKTNSFAPFKKEREKQSGLFERGKEKD